MPEEVKEDVITIPEDALGDDAISPEDEKIQEEAKPDIFEELAQTKEDIDERIAKLQAAISAVLPTGSLVPYSGIEDDIPEGFLLCDGAAVSRSIYPGLFLILGETYGAGDGDSTFAVPDMRGRFPLGKDNMGGTSANRVTDTDADALAGADGAETKDISHTHTGTASATTDLTNSGGGSTEEDAKTHTHSLSIDSGGSATQDIMNPFLTLNYIIKT